MIVDLAKNMRIVEAKIASAAKKAGRNPKTISIVAVSKQASSEAVAGLAALGYKDFGENRVQEGRKKIALAADDTLRWHLIGRIQTNKISQIAPFFLIHSLDRWHLAEKMSAYAAARAFRFPCLLQVNVAGDPAKAGIALPEIDDFIGGIADLNGLALEGLMTITALDADSAQTFSWFSALATKFTALAGQTLPENARMRWLSMGMSGDYELAVAAGANMLRIGSAIFAGESGHYA